MKTKLQKFLLLLLFTGVQFFANAQTKKDQDMTTVKDDEAAIRSKNRNNL